MGFVIWNVRSLYRAGLLMTAAKEIKNLLDLVGVQEVRWDRGGTEPAQGTYVYLSTERGMRIMNSVQIFLYIR
jgi:hypothetical protein